MAEHFILFLVLLPSLLAYSVSGQVFWRVNCGATVTYIDGNLMSWTPDTLLISNGVARSVQPSNAISTVLDTLRVFTTRKKNCYFTPVTKGAKLLVRASFNYGNYDKLSSPPTFDLHFDGNFWTTVETLSTGINVYEAFFVAKGDSVSVCVAQTKSGQFPFMSALEVGTVDSDVYSEADDDRALFSISRISYGASGFTRDIYDRIWVPALATGTTKDTSDAIYIDPTGTNNPPTEIFRNGVTVDSTAESLPLVIVPPSNTPLYITTYFSEFSDLGISGKSRSFEFYETNSSAAYSISEPISPPYGSMIEQHIYDYTVDSATNISLIATTDSDLPPLINAMELFSISEVLTDGTDSNDVAALALLQTTFVVLAQWSGDPCLPAPYVWDWLNCSNETPPRITSLYLNGFGLSGVLPDISSMDALQIIDLHNNSFDGEIPSFLGTMTSLQELNLADNDFSGPVPTSLSKNNKLKLTTTGNPSLCTSGKSCKSSPGTVNSSPGSTTRSGSEKKKSSMLPVVLGITIPIFFLIWVAVGVFIIFRKKQKQVNVNMPLAKGQTAAGANGNTHEMHNIGEQMMNEIASNVVQQPMGSPSPLLDNSGQSSDLYEETEVRNHEQS